MVAPEWPHITTRTPPTLHRAAVTHPHHPQEAATHPREEAIHPQEEATRHPNIRGCPKIGCYWCWVYVEFLLWTS